MQKSDDLNVDELKIKNTFFSVAASFFIGILVIFTTVKGNDAMYNDKQNSDFPSDLHSDIVSEVYLEYIESCGEVDVFSRLFCIEEYRG